jgi:hypothetical protein
MYNDTLLVEKKPTPRSDSLRGVFLKTFPCRLRAVMHCSGMCEFLLVLLAAVDEMTNNSLHNGDSLYFLKCCLYTLGPCTSAYNLLLCNDHKRF